MVIICLLIISALKRDIHGFLCCAGINKIWILQQISLWLTQQCWMVPCIGMMGQWWGKKHWKPSTCMWRLGFSVSRTVSESENEGQKTDRVLYLQEEELAGDKLVNKWRAEPRKVSISRGTKKEKQQKRKRCTTDTAIKSVYSSCVYHWQENQKDKSWLKDGTTSASSLNKNNLEKGHNLFFQCVNLHYLAQVLLKPEGCGTKLLNYYKVASSSRNVL